MAGLIYLSEAQQWPVAGWVFDHVLRVARRHLPREGASRIDELMAEAGAGLGYLSLEDFTPAEMATFRAALEAAYAEAEAAGEESFSDADFYHGFMARFEELLEMLSQTGKTPEHRPTP